MTAPLGAAALRALLEGAVTEWLDDESPEVWVRTTDEIGRGLADALLSREPLAGLAALEPKPGRWAFLDPETGDWIEVRDGTVWAVALGKEPTP